MAIKEREKTILGHSYRVTQLGAVDGHMLFVELAPMLTEVVGPLAQDGGGDLAKKLPQALGSIGEAIRKYLPPDRFIEVAKMLLGQAYRDGRQIVFEQDFGGEDMAALYPVLWFALEVNYGSFLDELGLAEFAGRLRERAAEAQEGSLPI